MNSFEKTFFKIKNREIDFIVNVSKRIFETAMMETDSVEKFLGFQNYGLTRVQMYFWYFSIVLIVFKSHKL